MPDHITQSQMERFCARSLQVPELVSVAEHLASCGTCHNVYKEAFQRRRDYVPVTFTLAPERWLRHEHLLYEQLAPYVESSLEREEREVVDLHLRSCGRCSEDVRSFEAYRQQVIPELAEEYVPAVRRKKLLPLWSWLKLGKTPVYATAGLVALLFGLILVAALLERDKSRSAVSRKPTSSPATEFVPTPAPVTTSVPLSAKDTNEVATKASAANLNSSSSVAVPIRQKPARAFRTVKENEPERPRASGEEFLALNDGQERVVINNSGVVSGLDYLPAETREPVREVLQAQDIERPAALSEVGGVTGTLRGAAEISPSFKLLSPGGTVIAGDHPAFKWSRIAGATSYRVQVVDSHNREVVNSGELPSALTEWQTDKPLTRGVVYNWVVTAVVVDHEVMAPSAAEPEMRFKILDEVTLRAIESLRRSERSHLALGILYAKAGMVAEAERELKAVVNQNPNSRLALRLLRSVQSWR